MLSCKGGGQVAENTFRRMEKKIMVKTSEVDALKSRVEEHMVPDKFNLDGKPYMICNLYYDDDSNSVIRNSIQLPKYKEKLRLRSYGVPDDDSKVFIELKKKFKGVGTKRRAKITLKEIEDFLQYRTYPQKLSYIDEQVLREIDYYLSHHTVYPRTYVSYLRFAYFAADDPSFRVTFDHDILTRRYDLDLRLGRYGDPLLPLDTTLVEVKFSGAVPVWFCRVMSDFGISFNTFSKYGTSFKRYTYDLSQKEGNLLPPFELTGSQK